MSQNIIFLLIFTANFLSFSCVLIFKNEQVHLSLGVDNSEMLVTWTSIHHNLEGGTLVFYGKRGQPLNGHAPAEVTKFKEGKTRFYVYRAAMRNLEPNTEYDYQVGGQKERSQVFHFRTHPSGNDWLPNLIVYGDLGLQNDQSLPYLKQDIKQIRYDAIFHIGDFAYDLYDRDGQQGHDFMNQIEEVAASIPYMTCAGNHEEHANFSHYDARFTMLADRHLPTQKLLSERMNNQYYSLDIGPVHIVVFSSELYYNDLGNHYFGPAHIEWQYKWLEQDLEKANRNRENVPWIFAMAHRPLYCFKPGHSSCNTEIMMREELSRGYFHEGTWKWGLEDLFYKYGVDLQFYGHEHHYVRTLPVYKHTVMAYRQKDGWQSGTSFVDPNGPIHVTTGSAGNKEQHPGFNPKIDSVNWVGHHQPDYGYTRLFFKDKLTINVQQISDDKGGIVTDDFTISKTKVSSSWPTAGQTGGQTGGPTGGQIGGQIGGLNGGQTGGQIGGQNGGQIGGQTTLPHHSSSSLSVFVFKWNMFSIVLFFILRHLFVHM